MNDNVTLSIQQMDGAWRRICADGPQPVVVETADVHYIFSGVPISFFNLALVTGSDLSADVLATRAREACAWATTQGVPWLFMVTHERLAPGVDAAATLSTCGLAPIMPMTGMLAKTVAPATPVPGLELRVPLDDAGCASILDVNGLAYGMDLGAGKPALGTRTFWKDEFPVVGMVAGQPVSTASVLMIDGHRYVALVATDPGQQRRGYADAAMRQALTDAAGVHGEKPTFLHATEAGRPVYERMGYAGIATHTLFLETRFLDAH